MRAWLLLAAMGCDGGPEGENTLFVGIESTNLQLSVGVPASIRFSTTGEPPFFWSRMGTIPGMTLKDDGTNQATMEGTPLLGGFFSVGINVRDANDDFGAVNLAVQVIPAAPPPMLMLDNLPFERATVGEPYGRYVRLFGGEEPLTWTSSLAPGLTHSPTQQIISGTPEQAGSFRMEVRVVDAMQRSSEISYQLDVHDPLSVETRRIPNALLNQPYLAELTATGGAPPYTWYAIDRLPDGLIFEGGLLRGAPTIPGDYHFTLVVRDQWDQEAGEKFFMTVAAHQASVYGALWPIPPFERFAPDFEVDGDAIFDPITEISWTRAAMEADSLAEAEALCGMRPGVWRLPTWIELVSIGGRYATGIEIPIDAPFFELWSDDARTWIGDGPGERGVLCVHADLVPFVERYDAAYGGDFDRYTTLVWSSDVLPCARDYTWGAKYCADLEVRERTDWRQPNVRELLSAAGPSTLGAQGFFDDPDHRRVRVDLAGNVVTASTARQRCVRQPRFDCTGLTVSFLVEPQSPAAGETVSLTGLAIGGVPCEVQHSWTIVGPDGTAGWPAFAPLQYDRQSATLDFVPLMPGLFDVTLTVIVDGFRNVARVQVPVEPASCDLSVFTSNDGAAVTAQVSGGVPPYRFAWHAPAEYCGGLGGFATAFTDTSSLAYSAVPGFEVEHRVVAIDAAGCLGFAD